MEREWKNGDMVVTCGCVKGLAEGVTYPAEVVGIVDRGDESGPRVVVMDGDGHVDWEFANVYSPVPRTIEDIVQEGVKAAKPYMTRYCDECGGMGCDECRSALLAAIIEAAILADREARG